MEIRASSGRKRFLFPQLSSRKRVYLRNVYDAKSDTILYGDTTIKVLSYTWDSKVSINRAIFFNNEKIRAADTLYTYLYKNDDSFLPIIGKLKLAWSPKIFGLSANRPPSKMYLITDMLGTAIQIGMVFCMVFTYVCHFVEEKYFKDRDKEILASDSNMDTPIYDF